MAECNAGALAAGVNNQRAGGGLYLFFKRLAELLQVPATFVFVLDGPRRPPIKRGHEVRRQPIWWLNFATELIGYFGYVLHQVSAATSFNMRHAYYL